MRPQPTAHTRRAANLRRLNDELLDQARSARILARFGDATQRADALQRLSKLQPMLSGVFLELRALEVGEAYAARQVAA